MDFAGARRSSALLVAFAATCVALGCSVTAQAQVGTVSPGGLGGPAGRVVDLQASVWLMGSYRTCRQVRTARPSH